jgi:GTPase
MIKTV